MIDFDNLRSAEGLYPDDIADIISCADMEKKAILAKVGKMVLSHRRYEEGWRWLEDLYVECKTGMEATSGLLTGDSGVGKSTLLKKFTSKFGGPFDTESGTIRPVVRVVTPPKPTEERLLKAMLEAFGVPELAMGRAPDLKRVLVRQIANQDTRLLIFDEFTHLLEDRTEIFAAKGAREVKSILSEGLCQIAFVGTPELEKIRQVYPQLKRRSAGDFELTPFNWDDEGDSEEWKAILKMIDDYIPIKSSFGFGSGDAPYKFHRATNGNLDNLIKLIFRATSISYDDGDEVLKLDVIAEAYERMRRGDKSVNPFGNTRKRITKPKFIHDEEEDEVTGLRNMPRQIRDSFSRNHG